MSLQGSFLRLLPWLWGNWISLLGTTLVTVSGNAILIILVVDLATGGANPYLTAFGYLVMPPAFIAGLLLIGLGAWRDRRRRGRTREPTPLDHAVRAIISDRGARRRIGFVLVATLVNVTLISVVTYEAVIYMDTPRFCGELCHRIMKPQYQAYHRSPHARVACVSCHIGPGASWFVRYKLTGLRQVWAAITGTYPRPIPVPVRGLRPARETCEQCHWPQKFGGSRILTRFSYTDDQANSRRVDVVRLKVQGIDRRTGRFIGIHWHVAPNVRIVYDSLDAKRTKIGRVELAIGGRVQIFAPGDETPGAQVHERRVMDCVDCHNQPTHIFDASPAAAVDQAMAYGRLDTSLPYLHQQAVRLLRLAVEPAQAEQRFGGELRAYYSKNYPDVFASKRDGIDGAARELGLIYQRDIFPKMKVEWGTYPSQLGHQQEPYGCWRCHDGGHQTKTGQVISQDCDLCHEVLAQDEARPKVPAWILRLGEM